MAELRPCAHEACSCEVRDDREFCSEHCAQAQVSAPDEDRCDCGHAECG